MRIALFHNLSSGGAKRALFEFVSRLSNRHHLDLFTLGSADHGFADLRPLVKDHRVLEFAPLPLLELPFGRLNNASRTVDLWRLRRLNRTIARLIEQSSYDVVFVNPCRYENSPSVINELATLPTVFYCQESLRVFYEDVPGRPYLEAHSGRRKRLDRIDPLPRLYKSVLKKRDCLNVRSASRVLVNSAFSRDNVNRAYEVDSRVSYLGVDSSKFRPSSSEKGRFLLSVGSLTPLKAFDFLVESVGRMPEAKRVPLFIVSNFENPPERLYLEDLAARNSVDLRLLGNVPEDRLVQLYNEASAVVYSPIREPFGFIPLEAMSCGTAVVAVAEGGISETVVDGQTGLLVERDPDQFSEAVLRLLEDSALARKLGRNGRAHVEEKWTWDCAVETLEAHLMECRAAAPVDQNPESI